MKLARAVLLEMAVRSWPWIKRGGFVALLLAAGWSNASGVLDVLGL